MIILFFRSSQLKYQYVTFCVWCIRCFLLRTFHIEKGYVKEGKNGSDTLLAVKMFFFEKKYFFRFFCCEYKYQLSQPESFSSPVNKYYGVFCF